MASRVPLGFLGAFALLHLAGCSSSDEAAGGNGSGTQEEEKTVDGRAVPPEATAGMVDFESIELSIPPGEERQLCVFMRSPAEELFVRDVQQFQGDGGHHAILMTTNLDAAEGSWVDCTQAEDMADYSLTLLPLGLPEGYAQRLPPNQALVLQSHYVNTADKALRVRDVVRLHTVDAGAVVTPAAPFATHNYDVVVGAGQTREVSFDCTLPRDMDLITVGGHMHEHGTAFRLEHVTTDGVTGSEKVELIYEVPAWEEEYRDSPPIDTFPSNPLKLGAGDVFRTTCAWNNTEDHEIGWPKEMCASFGLVAGSFEPFECNLGARGAY